MRVILQDRSEAKIWLGTGAWSRGRERWGLMEAHNEMQKESKCVQAYGLRWWKEAQETWGKAGLEMTVGLRAAKCQSTRFVLTKISNWKPVHPGEVIFLAGSDWNFVLKILEIKLVCIKASLRLTDSSESGHFYPTFELHGVLCCSFRVHQWARWPWKKWCQCKKYFKF